MSGTKEHDPLCHPRREAVADCICRELKTARLQGPVRENRHAPLCWCPQCLAASEAIHGTSVDALKTSLSGPAAVRTSEPEPSTSVAPAGEDYSEYVVTFEKDQ